MNKLLQLNKKTLLIILFLLSFFIIFSIVLKKIDNTFNIVLPEEKNNSFDMLNPSFTINNKGEKISVKAKRGNFIGKNLILLEDDVFFKSVDFELTTQKVLFNQKNETAESKDFSEFNSEGTHIKSEGFKITENGDIILFNGKSILILSK